MMGLVSFLACLLPERMVGVLARMLGRAWFYIVPIRRKVALANVARALGKMHNTATQRRIVRTSMQHYCAYAIEALRMPLLTEKKSESIVTRHNIAQLDALLRRNKGVIAVTAHIGNIDLLGSSQTVRGYPIHAIVKKIGHPSVDAFFSRIRNMTHLGCVAPKNSKAHIEQLLQNNQVVAFLIDQHMAKHRAIVCSLFEQLVSTTPAPVQFSMRCQAPILPVFISRCLRSGQHEIHFEDEFVLQYPHQDMNDNIQFNTERLNRIVERWVVAHKEQWLWMHKRFKVHDNPDGWRVPQTLAHLTPARHKGLTA